MRKILKNPLLVATVWWFWWGLISKLSLTGLGIPTNQTYIILSLFVVSLICGGLIVKLIPVENIKNRENSMCVEKNLNLLFKVFSYGLFVVLTILSVKCTRLLTGEGDTEGYKAIAFSTQTYIGLLFNSKNLENLYFFISSPLLFFVALWGLVDFWKNNNFKRLIIAFILNGMDAYIRLARVNIYMLIILFVFVLLFSDKKLIPLIKKKKKEFFIIFISFICIITIGFTRGYSTQQQLKMFAVDYHTVGFSLFDSELKNPQSPLNNNITYGRLFVGGLETSITIFIRQFNKNYFSPAYRNAIRLAQEDVLVGKIRYNSFYTLLYTFYSDGRYLGVALGGILLGFYSNYYFNRWEKFKDSQDAFYLILVFSVMIMSIFISQLEIMRTWQVLILVWIVNFSSKKIQKNII